jgi:MYXO-CTERM domain-containing protein
VGTCVPTAAGTDPNHDCIDSASDPTGVCGGKCNGQWACEFPAAGTSCGTCKQCDGASKCSVKPEDDNACGVIDCDQLDTSCMDYRDLQRNRCASLGVCKTANTTAACTDVLVTCAPDAGGGADASMPDGAGTGGDATGSDATVTPPKGGGGGCGCAVGADGERGGLSLLAGLFLVAGLVAGGRRRRRPRRE